MTTDRSPRLCQRCSKPISDERRLDAKYCSKECRRYATRLERFQALKAAEPRASDFRHLQDQLSFAPKEAVRYALLGKEDRLGERTRYPPLGKRSKHFDGKMYSVGSYSLRPFEPPRVPEPAIYGVLLFDAQGQEIQRPKALMMGVRVEIGFRRMKPPVHEKMQLPPAMENAHWNPKETK